MIPHAAHRSLQEMRLFYNAFPYPGRPLLQMPVLEANVFCHAGYCRLLARGERLDLCEASWREAKQLFAINSPLRHYMKCSGALIASAECFGTLKNAKIVSLGCGTDEPTLLRLLHPAADIYAVDLSKKSLRLAKLKERLSVVFRQFSRKSRYVFVHQSRVMCRYFCAEAKDFLNSQDPAFFDHVQCFGVLHHQWNPEELLAAIHRSLKPGGTARLMIYSHSGRRLERKLQQRYSHLWHKLFEAEDCDNVAKRRIKRLIPTFRLKLVALKLKLWNFLLQWGRKNAASYRFRYLRGSSVAVADALLHPSDPGLPLSRLQSWLERYGFKVAFCEAKIDGEGWVAGFGVSSTTSNIFSKVIDSDAKDRLLSNVTLVLLKDS